MFGSGLRGWDAGFSATRGRVLVLTWLLVRTLWAVDRWRVVSFFLALLLPAGAAVWLGAGGEVEASDGSFRGPRETSKTRVPATRNPPS